MPPFCVKTKDILDILFTQSTHDYKAFANQSRHNLTEPENLENYPTVQLEVEFHGLYFATLLVRLLAKTYLFRVIICTKIGNYLSLSHVT